ncbi:MAG: hypothetical protein AAF726_09570 [Planctomycetota bacterium]
MRLATLLALVVVAALWWTTRPDPPTTLDVDPVPAQDASLERDSDAAAEQRQPVRSAAEAPAALPNPPGTPVGPVDVHVEQEVAVERVRLPQAACAVELFAIGPRGDETRIEAGVTDSKGTWSYRGSAESPPDTTLLARIVEPGFAQRVSYVGETPYAEARKAFLRAERGTTIRGRVVDEDGGGVDAYVVLRRWRTQSGRTDLHRRFGARAMRGGWFELHLAESEVDETDGLVRGMLVAHAEGIGTAALPDQAWSLSEPPQDLVVVLHGGGVLRGTVRDADGAPAAGLPLRAAHANTVGSTKYSFSGAQAAAAFTKVDGNVQGSTVTRSDGSFEIPGLRPGPYHVRTRSSTWVHVSVYDVEITTAPVSTGPDPVELTYTRPHLVVALEDERGAAWSEALRIHRGRRASGGLPATWATSVSIQVVPAARFEGRWIARDADHLAILGGTSTGDGAAAFDVVAGADYLVSVVGRSEAGATFDGRPRHIHVPAGVTRHVETFRARQAGSLGVLEVDATVTPHPDRERSDDVNGLEAEPFEVSNRSFLVIEDPSSGMALVGASGFTSSPYRFELPAGTYRIVARPETIGHASEFGTLHGGAELQVEVHSGATTNAALHVGPGGRVRVAARAGGGSANLELIDMRGGRRPLARAASSKDLSVLLTNRWPAGESHDSVPLPAGDYRVVGTVGTRAIDLPLTIRDGETTELRVDVD